MKLNTDLKTIFLIFFMWLTISYSQKKSINLSLSSGISTPSSNFSNTSYASSGSFIELSGAYYFSKLGAGVSIGSFTNPTEGNFANFSNTQLSDPLISTTNLAENWKTTYYGVGPEFKASFGNAFEATFLTRIGSMSIKPIELSSEINVGNIDVATSVPVIRFGTTETTKLSYYSAGIKLGYKINDKLSLSFLANYLSSLSKEITVSQGVKNVRDLNKNGIIDQEDFIDADGTPLSFDVTTSTVKPQTTNFGIGLSYSFGINTNKIGNEIPSDNLKAEKKKRRIATKVDHTVNSGTVLFTNPSSKENKNKQQRKIVLTSPKNNSHFKSADEIENFDWELIGDKIPNPQYIIEITKIGSNQQPQRTYIGNTTDSKIAAKKVAKFKAGKALADELVNRVSNSGDINKEQAGDGQYRWKVIETTTGISSNPSYFTFSNCEIDFTITNEEIECLGYEQENLKFKICFDVTYASTSGDLTFVNPGTGLSVYDQTYAALSYTLVSPNPTLVTQIGATTSTISYCFEVTVSGSVTSIGFGLQGDDLDPSPITCQPGVSQLFDELPSCLCDDCEDIEVSFDDFNISLNGGTGNQFNFNGNINVNVPIYGMEFQIISYSYTANPSACTEGVSSVEESGMFLMPGTSINNSTSLQLFNETASGSANTNNNATKDIKYTSSSPLTGPIPVNLTIGLPGPISGLDPSCCVIDYEVCIKVIIYYDDGSCKSCVFTNCFQFNNQ